MNCLEQDIIRRKKIVCMVNKTKDRITIKSDTYCDNLHLSFLGAGTGPRGCH